MSLSFTGSSIKKELSLLSTKYVLYEWTSPPKNSKNVSNVIVIVNLPFSDKVNDLFNLCNSRQVFFQMIPNFLSIFHR